MGRIIGRIIMTLCCTILLAATVQAKTTKKVYLSDGGIIECQKVWQANGKVMVLVNRDTLVDLSKDEVDLKKTFAKKPVKHPKKKARKCEAKMPETAKEEVVTPPSAKPAVAPTTAQKPEPAPAKGTPPKPKVAANAVAKPVAPEAKPAAATPPHNAADKVKPAPPAAKQPPDQVAKPAPPPAKPAAPAAATPPEAPRANLPLAKPATPPPPPEKSFLAENMTNIGLGALLVLLVAGYLVYKNKQKG